MITAHAMQSHSWGVHAAGNTALGKVLFLVREHRTVAPNHVGTTGHAQKSSTWQCNNAISTGLVGICPCARRQRISPQAPQTLPPTPFWTVKSQFYADFGLITDICCSLCKFLQPEPSLWAASVLVSPQITYTRTRGNGV